MGPCVSLTRLSIKAVLAKRLLVSGEANQAYPDSRRRERLLLTGVKHETHGREYDPRADTCVKAFVRRVIAMLAEWEAPQDTPDTPTMMSSMWGVGRGLYLTYTVCAVVGLAIMEANGIQPLVALLSTLWGPSFDRCRSWPTHTCSCGLPRRPPPPRSERCARLGGFARRGPRPSEAAGAAARWAGTETHGDTRVTRLLETA